MLTTICHTKLLNYRLIQVLGARVLIHGKVRHAVAGNPNRAFLISSLNAIVHAHLARTDGVDLPGLKGVAIIPTDGVENALAWGYAGALPSPPEWDLVGSPLGKFRANTLLERAVNVSMEHNEADTRLPMLIDH